MQSRTCYIWLFHVEHSSITAVFTDTNIDKFIHISLYHYLNCYLR